MHHCYAAVLGGVLPVKKSYILNQDDFAFRQYILDIACKGATIFRKDHLYVLKHYAFCKIEQLAADSLVEWYDAGLKLTLQEQAFIRVVCSAFDLYLLNKNKDPKEVFSRAI